MNNNIDVYSFQSDNEAAQRVLRIDHNLVKLRPFLEASPQSREKAKLLGLYGIDIHKKRPKTSMVAANRMLNRALGIKGDRDKNKSSQDDPTNNEVLKGRLTNTGTQDSYNSHKRNFKEQNASASIAANRMFNRALGLKGDNKLKPRTRTHDSRSSTNTCDNYSKSIQPINNTSEIEPSPARHNRNNYDPNLAANRMFQRALGTSLRHHDITKEDG